MLDEQAEVILKMLADPGKMLDQGTPSEASAAASPTPES